MKLARIVVAVLTTMIAVSALAQTTPDMAIGLSPYATYIPSEIDNVNPANGNIFIKIPLLGYPQKGGTLRLNYYIYYNDKQWQANLTVITPQYGSSYVAGQWIPAGLGQSYSNPTLSPVGAYVARDQYLASFTNYNQTLTQTEGTGSDEVIQQTTYITQSIFTPDGATHFVGDGVRQTVSCGPLVANGSCPTVPSWGNGLVINHYPATDGSGYDQNMHDPDGIQYIGNAVTDPNGHSITTSSSGWTDTYGRSIPGTASGPGSQQFPNAAAPYTNNSYSDLIAGTPLSAVPSQCPSGTSAARSWTVPASSSYGGSATYYLCYSFLSFQTAFDLNASLPAQSMTYHTVTETSSSSGIGQALLLTAVVLPDLNEYTFQYDQYLSLIQLGLPSGGTISYQWQNVVFYPYPTVAGISAGSWGGMVTPISRALLTRTVNPGNGQPSITTSYHWNITATKGFGGNISNGVQFPAYSVVTDGNGNDTEYTLGGTDDLGTNWAGYVVTGVANYSGCSPHDSACTSGPGTRLKSVTYALTGTASGGAPSVSPAFVPQPFTLSPSKVVQTTTYLPGTGGDQLSMVKSTLVPRYGSCTVYTYPSWTYGSNNSFPYQTYSGCYSTSQIASTATYDFGSAGSGTVGPLLKTESVSYAWQSSSSVLAANMLRLVTRDTISDGNNNWMAETDRCYDGNGNNTSTQKFASAPLTHSCTTPPAGALVSSSQFNSQGVVTLGTDANGNQTQFSNFQCNGALPGTVTVAYGSSTTLPESTKYGYDCNIGKVTSVQDPNNQSTSFSYADPLGRVTQANYPDKGQISVQYSDVSSPGSFPLTMTVTKATGEAEGPLSTTTTYDGLARKTLTQTLTGVSGQEISVQTNYDNLGRELDVSNPYYSTSDSTFGWTSWKYDALGRKLYQCNADNGTSPGTCAPGKSYQQWAYSGNSTTVTNENGSSWVHTADGLGRLIQVSEPGALFTNYFYDVLGNLLCGVQRGTSTQTFTTCANSPAAWRPRSFSYDGLSRLQSATNPESGTVTYSYDLDSNVIARTDARGIKTNYSYDALNRPLSKWYSDGVTLKSCYQYDSSSVMNGIGRLASAWTQLPGTSCSSAPTGGSFLAAKSVLAYDPMGRPTNAQQQQCVNGKCSASTPYSLAAAYDLAGNLTSYTNSVGANGSSLTLTNAYDSAGWPCLTISSWTLPNTANNPTAPANLFQVNPSSSGSSAGYVAPGGLQNWSLGANSSTASSGCGTTPNSTVNLQQVYVPRLWVTNFSASGQVP